MATITKRGNSYRVTISLYKKGVYKRETKTFKDKKDAELWALEMELEKGKGKNIADRTTKYPQFYRNWIETIKKNEVRDATYINYKRTLTIIEDLFYDIQLKNLNDIVIQKNLIYMHRLIQKKLLKN